MYFHSVVGKGSYTTSTTNMYNKDFTHLVGLQLQRHPKPNVVHGGKPKLQIEIGQKSFVRVPGRVVQRNGPRKRLNLISQSINRAKNNKNTKKTDSPVQHNLHSKRAFRVTTDQRRGRISHQTLHHVGHGAVVTAFFRRCTDRGHETGATAVPQRWFGQPGLKISKIEKSVSLDHTRNCIQT